MNIHDFSLFDNDEYNKIVVEWNRTEKEYPREKTVVDLFEEQAALTGCFLSLSIKTGFWTARLYENFPVCIKSCSVRY